MQPSKSLVIGCCFLFILITYSNADSGQCSNSNVCEDCFDWCSHQALSCHLSLIQNFCKKTCNSCVPEICSNLNCSQKCIRNGNGQNITCSCYEGYRLENDGQTCTDIDECAENSTICQGISPRCTNILGTYACTACSASQPGIYNYYSSPFECCKLNRNSTCGKSVNNIPGRIADKRNVKMARWPWSVYIKVGDKICSGSLIKTNYVITSASCVSNHSLNMFTIIVGNDNISDTSKIYQQILIPKKIYVNPQYAFTADTVALIEVNTPVYTGIYTDTICLPGSDQPPIGKKCYAIGYNNILNSPILQEFDYSIVNNSLCNTMGTRRTHPDIHMCTENSSRNSSECKEISGGPFVCQRCNSCDWYLAGISLFENACSQFGSHKVFTRITAYQEWITEITKQEISYRRCVKPSWQSWSSWSECNATCGLSGFRSRTRLCSNGSVGDPGCYGKNIEKDDCIAPPCGGIFTPWSSNGNCSMPCGGGSRQRTRQCHFANGCFPDGDGSITTQFETCNTEECVGEWTTWNTVEDCSASCDGGTQLRTRFCTEASGNMATGCFGPSKQIVPCNTNKCSLVSCAEKVNLNEDKVCNVHALYNYCIVYYKYMEENCNLSCCQWRKSIGTFSPSYCGDLYSSQSCQSFWKNCIDPRMQKFCKKTCGIC